MQHAARFILLAFLFAVVTDAVGTTEDAPETAGIATAEYQRSDANFYPKGDVARAHPSAVIIAREKYTRKGDSYFFTPKIRAPKEMYVETLTDWIEPITPPDRPAALAIPPDAMQIREPQGDVRVALPSAPANFGPAREGMALPNGAVVKTGADGTAAVLFGGVDSARLMPNSEAAMQQAVTAQARSAEIDLTKGGVFSKVGTQLGVKGEYEVHTPFGNAGAQGGDFVTIISGSRTDAWIAQGTVDLERPDSRIAETATSDGMGPLKILRFPRIADSRLSVQADVETLTAILNFIPLANQKTRALRDKIAAGATLTANERTYLDRIKQVPCLLKLALAGPSAPVPAMLATAPPPAPAVTSAPSVVPAPPTPAALAEPAPIRAVVRVDGKINFQGVTLTPAEFKTRLEAMVKATPDQPIIIKAGKTVAYEKIKVVIDICAAAEVQRVSFALPASATVPVAGGSAPNLPAPNLLMHPSMEPRPNPPAVDAAPTKAPASAGP